VEQRWGEGGAPGGRRRERERCACAVCARWEGVGEVDRGEADVWAHELVVGMEEKYER
jgi:hypothetical protein